MTRSLFCSAAIVFWAWPALAQVNAFFYLAPGGAFVLSSQSANQDAFVHVGGGAEYVLKNRIGIEADAGALGTVFGGTRATVSVDGAYHFRNGRAVDPFVAAGYSWFAGYSTAFFVVTNQPQLNLVNYGGGVNFWFSHHFGVKIAARDHVHSETGTTLHFAEFMLGLGVR